MYKTLTLLYLVGVIFALEGYAQSAETNFSKENKSVKSLKIENIGSEFLGKINIEEATGYSGDDTIFFNLLSKGDISIRRWKIE